MVEIMAGTFGTALNSARESLTVSDCSRPDMPLVYVNKGFEEVTGYRPEEVVGKNCRFLQGAFHEQAGVLEMRAAMKERKGCIVELVNFRKDGSRFQNRLSLTPLFDAKGKLRFYIGLQNDITVLNELRDKLASHLRATMETNDTSK
ncbi:MAG TPA: PAS domain-containing protein [Acetobacteraceae bacterium]|nr:PAS domain-containing protein [Acetobacteraceae bacterium]